MRREANEVCWFCLSLKHPRVEENWYIMMQTNVISMTLQKFLIISVPCFCKWPDHCEIASDAPDSFYFPAIL